MHESDHPLPEENGANEDIADHSVSGDDVDDDKQDTIESTNL